MDVYLTALAGFITSIISGFLLSVLNKKTKKQTEDNLAERIQLTTKKLSETADEIITLQQELESRVNAVEKLKREAIEAENIIKLTNEQVQAIQTQINKGMKEEGRRTFWKGFLLSLTFFIAGAVVSYIIQNL